MSLHFQPRFDFDAVEAAAADGEALVVDLDGFEGPLHVLLELARRQKVDLLQLSITRLADQFLAFVQAARSRRFALAADYLVMASWLAYLKSRLLLPKPEEARADEPPAQELAEALAFRLAKLDAMRRAVEALKARPQLKRDVFPRGDPQAVTVKASERVEGDLHALILAYIGQRRREAGRRYEPERRVAAYPLEAARERLRALAPQLTAWTPLEKVAPASGGEGVAFASCVASTLSAGLEMVKDGDLEASQLTPFAELMLRARRPIAPLIPAKAGTHATVQDAANR